MKIKGSSNEKTTVNLLKNDANFQLEKTGQKIASKFDFGRVLGSIWEGFGTIWGLFWALLGASGSFWGGSKSSFYRALVQDGLQEAFWIDLGCFLEGFGKVWGRIWEDFNQFWNGFWRDLGKNELHGAHSLLVAKEFQKGWGRVSK